MRNKWAMITQAIGYIAGTLTTLSFLPQVLKAWKTRSTKDISLSMFIMFTLGVALWLVYGVMINEMPIIIANLVTIVLAASVLAAKLRYG